MVGLDTNLLVRYFLHDDAAQTSKTTALMATLTSSNPGFISVVTIAELAWVLGRIYRMRPTAVAAGIDQLLASNSLRIQHSDAVFAAIQVMRHGDGDFADALIAALGEAAGCTTTYTFDRAALRLPGFTAL